MSKGTDRLVGLGLYTPSEAALYARMPTETMLRWLYGDRRSKPVLTPQVARSGDDRVVTFIDFVQALAIRNLRLRHRVPLDAIRSAIAHCRRGHGVEYPLAREHTLYVHGKAILIQLPGQPDLVEVSPPHQGQRAWFKVLEPYLEDIHFGANGLARLYVPYKYETEQVVMDPQRRFGEPLVESCGLSARVLWEAYRSEGSFEAAAAAYEVTKIAVITAVKYFDPVEGKIAA